MRNDRTIDDNKARGAVVTLSFLRNNSKSTEGKNNEKMETQGNASEK